MYDKITMEKQYQTRNGRQVRLLCIDGPRCFPVLGIVEGDEFTTAWNSYGQWEGALSSPCPIDLVPIPIEHTRWILMTDEAALSRIYDCEETGKQALATIGSPNIHLGKVTWIS